MTLSSAPESEDAAPLRTLIDALLDEQQRMTAVERFARQHDRGDVPAQARYYRDLIPLTKPAPGQQYAFAVDLDVCTGCKACVSACHSLNGLEENETWRSVGFLQGGSPRDSYRQTITTACHHCVEPGCLEGCPVMAYDKDEETGIVRHLDDQCIGCQYCVLKCPYDVPQYSERLGIVRKCDMCTGRLGAGEAPACVQACPHEAITIELVERAEIVRAAGPGTAMLPGAFDSSYTKPTSRFFSANPVPANAKAGDESALRLEHAHWPLIFMLLLTQMAAGIFAMVGVEMLRGVGAGELRGLGLAGWLALHAGLTVSILHLGRPLGAWRFFLGLRTSWMSREILVFSTFSMLAGATVAMQWLPVVPMAWIPALLQPWMATVSRTLPWCVGVTAATGLAGVFTSVMIYVDTRRAYWSAPLTAPKFFGTMLLLGTIASAGVREWIGARGEAWGMIVVAMALRVGLFFWERSVSRHLDEPGTQALKRVGRTIWNLLPWVPAASMSLFLVSLLGGATALLFPQQQIATGAVALALGATFADLLIERFCFFTTCPTPRMPGGVFL